MSGVLDPLGIFIAGLGGGFLIPLADSVRRGGAAFVFVLALTAMTLISGGALLRLTQGAAPFEILTGGAPPPLAINLRMGLPEALVAFTVNLVGLAGAAFLVREKYGIMLLCLLLIMGVQGMAMTRDLFNLFVFLEIVSIATYGLLSLGRHPAALSATFKYLMATIVASTFFLLGAALVYAATGDLNIDIIIGARARLVGPVAFAGLMFLLASLLIELKPFPANGWGLDVYETARGDVAALISGAVSAGVFFALVKLLPLFTGQLEPIAALSVVTFLFSNLIGLRQTKAQRLLGYSSIGQMSLMTLAAALLELVGADGGIVRLVIGGLFVNHLFAKVGLFWLARYVGKERLEDWSALVGQPGAVFAFAILLSAVCGFPPFPGFWAKWRLILALAEAGRYVWIALILAGSLIEAAYLFRWFGRVVHGPAEAEASEAGQAGLVPVFAMAALVTASGYATARLSGLETPWSFLPLVLGLALYPFDRLREGVKCAATIAFVLIAGLWMMQGVTGVNGLFAAVLFAGCLVLPIACFYRSDSRPGFYPLLTVMLLSLVALPCAATRLEFFFLWELITLSSYFLILRRGSAQAPALTYLLFSLLAAFFLLAGFAALGTGSVGTGILALANAQNSSAVLVLLGVGCLIKAGAAGVHVWLPGAYAEADDDVSALLSAAVSKASMFGLLIAAYVAARSEAELEIAHVLAWIGMLTTLVGALLAAQEDDMKRMLAYSSMSQIGYIIAAVALVSHLGWVTALYLVANHLLVKGILFLVAAAVILRVGERRLSHLGGLGRAMPLTFAAAAVGVVSMSGLPPLAGFGGKFLLLNAMIERGWYVSAGMTLLATFAGFVYMARFLSAIFLGPPKSGKGRPAEAPVALLAPQYLCIAGILTMSLFPKLLIGPISGAIDPHFASTLVWKGMSLEMVYSSWNPTPVMAFSVAVAAILFALIWLFGGAAASGGSREAKSGFYETSRRLFVLATPPWASAFWSFVAGMAAAIAQRARAIYTGDARTYTLYAFYYVLLLYGLCLLARP